MSNEARPGTGAEVGRPPKYTDAEILDAALEVIAERGAKAATVVSIARRLGAPSGSIYHRFDSRDAILAQLWIRAVQRFQRGFLTALRHGDPAEAAQAAAAHTLSWTADHRAEASVLVLYRRADLLARWPANLGDELITLNDEVARAIKEFAATCFGVVDSASVGRARFALIDLPHAAARQVLSSEDEPALWLEGALLAAVSAVVSHR